MPKAEGKEGVSKAAAPADGDAQLAADVKAQLAQLGLGGGGGFSDAAFDDFAPQKAKQRIGQKPAAGKKQQQQEADNKASRPDGGRRQDAAPGARQQQQQGGRGQQQGGRGQQPRAGQQQQGGRGQQQGGRGQQQGGRGQRQPWQKRSWQQDEEQQEGAAPKVPNAKSILPKDEPAIWHEAASTLPALPAPRAEAAPDVVQQRRKQAERLLLVEEQAFEQNVGRRSSADAKWLQQVRRGGTTADRVAAASVLVQDGAAANLPSLDTLLAMCAKKGGARAVVGSALDALKELFMTVLLPDRKLRFFEQQALDKVEAGREGERRLLYWLVEDGVKKRYAAFVETLDTLSRDNLEFVKDRAVKTMYELLSAKPEQEARLLAALVNKLGDPDRKLASKVGYLLTRLLAEHPAMNLVVVREVERFMFRPGLLDRARYYAVVYLNQMVLSHRQPPGQKQGGSLAKRLIDVYFTLFRMILDGKIGTAAQLAKQQADKAAAEASKRKRGEAAKARAAEEARRKVEEEAASAAKEQSGEMDGRMLSALITGVRRAFPYVPADEVEPLIEAHADSLFRLVHARSFGVATQALLLLFQLMSSRSTVSDRFYRALYAVLCSPELQRSSKAPMFLSLLFKALQADVSARRTAAFAKRMLQVAAESPAHFACGCLLMLSELLKARPSLWGAVLQAEEGEGDGLEHFKDAPEDEGGAGSGPAAADGADGGERQRLGNDAAAGSGGKGEKEGEEGGLEESEEEEEEEEELAEGSSDEDEEDEEQGGSGHEADLLPAARQQATAVAAAAQQRQQQQARRQQEQRERWPASREAYDMSKREPLYCHAERSCLWELTSLASHVHPSVAAMARTLLAGQNVVYGGDPLRDLTLAAFLEKFVQKKAKAGARGDSAMQPLAAAAQPAGAHTWAALAGAQSEAISMLAEKDIRPDDLFFHKYYSLQAVQAKAAKKKKKQKGEDEELLSDAGSDDSDAADAFLAGEEEGGDDGIGADPDRGGMDYDYANLAAAMDSDSADSAEEEEEAGAGDTSEDGEGASSGDDGAPGGRPPAGGSDDDDVEVDDDEAALEPAGATFSDMSDSSGASDEEDGAEGGQRRRQHGGSSDESEDEDASDPGSDPEGSLLGSEAELDDHSSGEESSDDDGGFEAELAAGDLSEDEAEESSGDEDGDAKADAEVAALIRRHTIQPLPAGGAASDNEEAEALNPFELPSASSSDDEGEGARQGTLSKRKTAAAAQPGGGGSTKKKKKAKSSDPMGIFASADDYAEMIQKDMEEAAGLDDGQGDEKEEGQQQRGRSGRQRGSSASGRGGRGPTQQQAGSGGGRGRGGRGPKRQQGGGGGNAGKRPRRWI